jgi:hypothetical protein
VVEGQRVNALQGGGPGMNRVLRSSGLWWLIPGQVALGTMLLASAGVLIKTVQQLKVGIEATAPERVWFADLQTDTALPGAGAFSDFQERIRAHLRTLPGTEGVGIATGRPLSTISRGPLRVEGMTTASEPIDLTIVLRTGEHQRLNRDQLFQYVLAFDPELFVDRVWTFEEEAAER